MQAKQVVEVVVRVTNNLEEDLIMVEVKNLEAMGAGFLKIDLSVNCTTRLDTQFKNSIGLMNHFQVFLMLITNNICLLISIN